jgi:hypothetical protein
MISVMGIPIENLGCSFPASEECKGVSSGPVRTEEMQLMRESVVTGLSHDGGRRCDSDSTSQEHGQLG